MADTQSSASVSNSLSERFNNLNLGHNEPNTSPAPPIPLTIPQLITYGRRIYFGIETTEEWLVQYAKDCGFNPARPTSQIEFLGQGLAWLQAKSGIRSIKPKNVFAQSTRIPPQPTKVTQPTEVTYPLSEYPVPIVAICSAGERSFANRPSQAQVDRLKQIMGGEPMWWVEDG
jgi:hypothetical protein